MHRDYDGFHRIDSKDPRKEPTFIPKHLKSSVYSMISPRSLQAFTEWAMMLRGKARQEMVNVMARWH